MPPSPMIGSIRMPAVSSLIAASTALDVAERRDLVEAVDRRAEAFEMFRLAAGGDGGQRAPMKGALECDEAIALGRAVR